MMIPKAMDETNRQSINWEKEKEIGTGTLEVGKGAFGDPVRLSSKGRCIRQWPGS